MDKSALFKLTSGLYVVSTQAGGRQNGCVVNTVVQVTAEPPKLMVAVNKNNLTAQLIQQSGLFNAVALGEDTPMDHIARFGFTPGAMKEKYDRGDTQIDENGLPYVRENGLALLSVKVCDTVDAGTHLMFIGEVTQAENLNDGQPLTYNYYHKVKKGSTPRNAASYQKPQ